MSPPRLAMDSTHEPIDCPAECSREDRIVALEEAMGSLTREIAESSEEVRTLSQRIGSPSDKIAETKATGITGAIETLTNELLTQREQEARKMEEIKQELKSLRSEVESVRQEFRASKEAPSKVLKTLVLLLPLVTASCGAIWWIARHVQITP